jgi:hypothetical protein
MKRSLLLIFTFTLSFNISFCQVPNFANDIAVLIWKHCSSCHHDGGIANSSLMSYSDVFNLRNDIRFRINSTDAHLKMPPWSPDPNYRHFIGERVLTQSEINLISQWVDSAAPEGDSTQTPAPPIFSHESAIGTADLSLRMPDYRVNAPTGAEDFVCFTLPTGLSTNKMIKAIEIIPGNRDVVHHVSLMKNSTGFQTDTSSHVCMGSGRFISGYVPGTGPLIFPDNDSIKMGIPLLATENLVLNIHYASGSNGQIDSTRVNLFFHDDNANVREIKQITVSETGFCIAPNSIDTISISFPEEFSHNEPEISILSVNAHAHWIGKEFLIYMADSFNNVIPLLYIPRWLFLWQDYYFYKYPIKYESGYKIFTRALYDNTAVNIFNQYSPPQTVCSGQYSTDEMFSVFFNYVDYQSGDEYIDMEPYTITAVTENFNSAENLFAVFPNPFTNELNIQFALDEKSDVRVSVFNLQGQALKLLLNDSKDSGVHFINWTRTDEISGIYIVQLISSGRIYSKKVILR